MNKRLFIPIFLSIPHKFIFLQFARVHVVQLMFIVKYFSRFLLLHLKLATYIMCPFLVNSFVLIYNVDVFVCVILNSKHFSFAAMHTKLRAFLHVHSCHSVEPYWYIGVNAFRPL